MPAVLIAGGALPASGVAAVKLVHAYAQPVDPSPEGVGVAPRIDTNQTYQCKPEQRGKFEYGTQTPFDPTKAPTKGSFPSQDDLTPDLQAGGSADLCFGFALTPDMQPEIVPTFRDNDPANPLPVDPDATIGARTAPVDGDDLKRATVTLPAGFAGSPDDVPQCSDAQFATGTYRPVAAACGSSIVGTAWIRAYTYQYVNPTATTGVLAQIAGGGQPNPIGGLTGGGIIFNLQHGPNELARLGVQVSTALLLAPVKFVITLTLAPDGRVQALVDNAPRETYLKSQIDGVTGLPIEGARRAVVYLESIGVRTWGRASDHPATTFTSGDAVTYTSGLTKDFGQFGTSCTTPSSASVDVTTYGGVSSSATSAPYTLTGCEGLEFRPSITVDTTEKRTGVPTAATVRVSVDQNLYGQPRTAMLRNAAVTLPKGLELGAQIAGGADGLPLCSAAQFAKDSTADNTCPAASSVGDVSIQTPLLTTPFTGKVYLGEQSAVGELPKLYLQAQPQGATAADAPRIKLVGDVKANDDGTITTTFTDAPQLRFSVLQLQFRGGSNALFVTPRTCDVVTGPATFTSWAGQTVQTQSTLQMTDDCSPQPFAPSFSIASDNPAVGASAPTAVTIQRPDRSPWLTDVKVSLPTGFLADLNAASECSAAAAAAAACPDSSRIATVTSRAGAGDAPTTLTGSMFLTERQVGAVAGASIVVRAKLGDLDLGNVIVPARIDLRPTDAGLTLTTTAPTRFRNLPLFLRSITVKLDRPGFPLNPTACGPLRATATLGGEGGASATVDQDVSYTGCAGLPFKPAITAQLTGTLKPLEHPGVRFTMTPRAGDTNLRSVSLVLPKDVSTDLKNINPCPQAAFDAGACPAIARVGSVKAKVSITPDELSGDVFLVKVAGFVLPGIGMNFTGRYAQRVLSTVKTDPTGRLITNFAAIPDLPLRSLDLQLDASPKSPLIISPEGCKSPSTWDATFGGQGGQSLKTQLPSNCSVAKADTSLTASRRSGLRFVAKAPAGKRLTSVRLTLPRGLSIRRSAKELRRSLRIKATKGTVTFKVTAHTIQIKAKGSGPQIVSVTLRPSGLKGTLKKGRKVSVRTAIALTASTPVVTTLSAKTK